MVIILYTKLANVLREWAGVGERRYLHVFPHDYLVHVSIKSRVKHVLPDVCRIKFFFMLTLPLIWSY